MQRLTGIHVPEALTFVETDERFSVYRKPDGTEVYLAHGTGRELVHLDDLNLRELWTEHLNTGAVSSYDHEAFRDLLRERLIDPEYVDDVGFCADCNTPNHVDDQHSTNDGHGDVCDRCIDRYWTCNSCEERYRSTTTTLHDTEVCSYCRDEYYNYCDSCEGYYHPDNGCGEGHDDSCDCESPAQRFKVRNDGEDLLPNDTRTTITLPAGVISDEGLYEIANFLRAYSYDLEDLDARRQMVTLSYRLGDIGPTWQAKQGNFTKRLSRLAYKEHEGLKIPPQVLSQVGNIARDHSKSVDFEIEVTRNLNMGPDDFYHEDSCWWQSYSASRCALKTNGGIGLRSFHPDGWVTGRAWVMPLKLTHDGYLTPTFETLEPDAFVIFNGYGNLEGYTAARIWSHMAGMTYRKISFACSPMYVNSDSGFLVAPEEIAERYTDGSLSLGVEQHANLHAREMQVLTNA